MLQLSNSQKLIYETEKYAGGAVAVICGSVLLNGLHSADELTHAVHEIFRRNEALRIRMFEQDGQIRQEIVDFQPQPVNILRFENKNALTIYAEEYAKTPVFISGPLCEIQIILLPDQCGLLVKCHHIVGDAWSLTLIASQLCALISGKEPTAFPYSEYIEGEKDYAHSRRWEKDRMFFLEQFKQCPEPTYISEKSGDSYIASRATFCIDIENAALIRTYAKEHNTSPFVLFLTAFAVYFSRIRDNAEWFYIGTPILNRGGFREKHTMGMFINSAPILVHIGYDSTFAENLAIMQEEVLSVFRHQKFHYNDILTAIRHECGFIEKLYDVVLSYQNATVTDAESGVETAWYHSGIQTESLQVHIDDRDKVGTFRVHIDYRTDKFTAQEIQRVYSHIVNILSDAILSDTKKIGELKLLSAEEEQKLLVDFNDTAADYPRGKCVHTLFEEQVGRMADKTAVIACDRTLTYRELNSEANRIAHGLIERGVKPGDIVAFALPRNSCLIPVMFAILKAGAAYLPIDMDYPQERIKYMLEDSSAKVFVTQAEIACLMENNNVQNPELDLASDISCYCIYTSGSTGKPKGTLLTHKNAINYIYGFHALNAIAGCKKILSVSSVSFDIFITESLYPLLVGSEILLANEEQTQQPSMLAKLLCSYSVDMIQAPPTKVKALLLNDEVISRVSNLKTIVCGGETPSQTFILELQRNLAAKVMNMYGPTETTVAATAFEIEDASYIPIGKPIANTQIYIMDKHMAPVPIGVTGELCIAGDGVGVGYLNRPELTAEKFVPNPFGSGRFYKTGDLAYWKEDGNIVYVGRNDFQVKIRGLRIELGEIENAISMVDGVSQAVVVIRKDDTGRQLICAFYTEDAPVKLDAVKDAIRERLPRYMMPHIFTKLTAFPTTPSGKTDRNALPDVDLSVAVSDVEYIAPATDAENIVSAAVANILGLERVGMHDNFFDLGGDSLKAIELAAALEKEGYFADVKTIFESETLGALSGKLDLAEVRAAEEIIQGDIPATQAQMRVYIAQSMSGGTTYNIPCAFKVSKLDPTRLQNAVDKLVSRYEILRTHFENRDGTIMQVGEDNARCRIEKLSSNDISAFIRPFNLEIAPLLRIGYFENTVLLDMHHIIADGGSLSVFLRELNEFYMGRELEDRAVQYREFAMNEHDNLEDEDYWLNMYKEKPPVLELNTDYPRPTNQSYEGAAIYHDISIELHKRICGQSRKLGITPFAYYLAAFYILLSKFSGNEDIVVGTPASGRNGKFINALGMFVNTLALRAYPEGKKTVGQFLSEVKIVSRDALSHQRYPYGELVQKLGISAENHNPLFDVMFAYQNQEMTETVFEDAPVELLQIPIATSKYDFTLNIMPRKNDVVLMIEYCTALFNETTIQRFIEGYKLLLSQMLDEGKVIYELSVISEAERHMLLIDFNDSVVDYPKDKYVHQIFEEQVRKNPYKTAIIACDRSLSYQELNDEANCIANGLIEKGVKPGDIVGFALPRDSHLIATMFGILKTGAAYLPIDPDYPQQRKDALLRESNAKYFIVGENLTALLSKEPIIHSIMGENLYCVIPTSGSTGTPKLSTLTHSGILNFSEANANWYRDISSACAFTIYTFDCSILETIIPLIRGIPVVLADEDAIYNQSCLEKLLESHPQTLMFATPTKLKQYIGGSIRLKVWKNVTRFIVGGEVFPEELLSLIRGVNETAEVINLYGPSEATICVTTMVVEPGNITIGSPIANIQIYIVDKYMHLVPVGVTGELCIAGDGVGAGYLNRPELTDEKFVQNPFGSGKLYKTGDLAYWRKDGNIIYVGRNDFQVKIRGLRIELGEIENAIVSVEGVNQAVVSVRKDEKGRQLICAFYVSGDLVTLDEIKSAIRNKLPRYMMPHIFTRLDKLPLTSSGKIDRKALPEVDLHDISFAKEFVAPASELERRLAALMEKVLEYSPVGREDNFFDLGGDSLKAIEFLAQAHTEEIYFSLQNIFEYPTVRELSEFIELGSNPINSNQKSSTVMDNKSLVPYKETDFTAVNAVLAKNRAEIKYIPDRTEVGNILLAGATGYLGIHILADYLDNDKGIAYCLVRGENQADSEKRLKELLKFYFGEKYISLLGVRIQTFCGDLQKDNFDLNARDYQVLLDNANTVINAAASVKHYGSYKYFYDVNVDTTRRIVDFCKHSGVRLIHISTISVSGNGNIDVFDGYVSDTEKHFYEDSLYIGQPLENVYARSKFEAEKLVLESVRDGVQACIMRMGNLTNRASDGVFQINYKTNAAAQRIKGVLELGMLPDYLIEDGMYVEFTPIDEAAKAIMLLARHFDQNRTVFHINSTKVVYLNILIKYFSELGYPIQVVSGKEFASALRGTARQAGMEHILELFINDLDEHDRLNYDSNIRIENRFTEEYLRRLGFTWGEIGLEYLRKYTAYFEKIGYWRIKENV